MSNTHSTKTRSSEVSFEKVTGKSIKNSASVIALTASMLALSNAFAGAADAQGISCDGITCVVSSDIAGSAGVAGVDGVDGVDGIDGTALTPDGGNAADGLAGTDGGTGQVGITGLNAAAITIADGVSVLKHFQAHATATVRFR